MSLIKASAACCQAVKISTFLWKRAETILHYRLINNQYVRCMYAFPPLCPLYPLPPPHPPPNHPPPKLSLTSSSTLAESDCYVLTDITKPNEWCSFEFACRPRRCNIPDYPSLQVCACRSIRLVPAGFLCVCVCQRFIRRSTHVYEKNSSLFLYSVQISHNVFCLPISRFFSCFIYLFIGGGNNIN